MLKKKRNKKRKKYGFYKRIKTRDTRRGFPQDIILSSLQQDREQKVRRRDNPAKYVII